MPKARDHLSETIQFLKKRLTWDFPGGLVVKTSPSNAGGVGLIPGDSTIFNQKSPHILSFRMLSAAGNRKTNSAWPIWQGKV